MLRKNARSVLGRHIGPWQLRAKLQRVFNHNVASITSGIMPTSESTERVS